MNAKIKTPWQRAQVKRLRSLLDYAETLSDHDKRALGLRLLHLTQAVEALNSKSRHSGSYNHIATLIDELEAKRFSDA